MGRGLASDASKTPEFTHCVVTGSGSFGTAMATVLARKSFHVTMLSRSHEVVEGIRQKHRNPHYLSDFPLPWNLTAAHQEDAERVFSEADFVVHSVPVQASLEYLRALSPMIPAHVPIVSTSKGIHTESLKLMSEIIPEALGRQQPCAFLSGPSFARELLAGYPTGLVAASVEEELASRVARLFQSDSVRVWTSTDVVGVELAGALKNPYAIASGLLAGLGLGMNTTALLVTRAIAEMNRLAAAMGSTEPTLVGLSGVGDLMLTSFGGLSRNRTVGMRLGAGETIEEIRATMDEVAEGVATTPAAVKLAEAHGVDVPIIQAVDDVIQGRYSAPEALLRFMRIDADWTTNAPEAILPNFKHDKKVTKQDMA